MKAADYLNIECLLDLLGAKIASLLKGKSVEEARRIMGIRCDFSEKESQEIREQFAWADDL